MQLFHRKLEKGSLTVIDEINLCWFHSIPSYFFLLFVKLKHQFNNFLTVAWLVSLSLQLAGSKLQNHHY